MSRSHEQDPGESADFHIARGEPIGDPTTPETLHMLPAEEPSPLPPEQEIEVFPHPRWTFKPASEFTRKEASMYKDKRFSSEGQGENFRVLHTPYGDITRGAIFNEKGEYRGNHIDMELTPGVAVLVTYYNIELQSRMVLLHAQQRINLRNEDGEMGGVYLDQIPTGRKKKRDDGEWETSEEAAEREAEEETGYRARSTSTSILETGFPLPSLSGMSGDLVLVEIDPNQKLRETAVELNESFSGERYFSRLPTAARERYKDITTGYGLRLAHEELEDTYYIPPTNTPDPLLSPNLLAEVTTLPDEYYRVSDNQFMSAELPQPELVHPSPEHAIPAPRPTFDQKLQGSEFLAKVPAIKNLLLRVNIAYKNNKKKVEDWLEKK